jgi:hypothetical protein
LFYLCLAKIFDAFITSVNRCVSNFQSAWSDAPLPQGHSRIASFEISIVYMRLIPHSF